jgi:hypothetical protein
MSVEKDRLEESRTGKKRWKRWGPYLSERQWGTVREDYSPGGTAWDYFTHDMARSRAFRWGEDGIAGISDDQQRLCFAVALWNGRDPILKERLFGVTGVDGNHGEDVKEHYYYLDSTPTHSYMKMLYKYPQAEFPYGKLVEENQNRGKTEPEFELLDTGVFDEDRYFDVIVEYAKASPQDVYVRITAHNRGPEDAPLHLIPQVWFRNTWSWGRDDAKPRMHLVEDGAIEIEHTRLKRFWLYHDGDSEALFCENESNPRGTDGDERVKGFFKDGIDDYVVNGEVGAVNPSRIGTKAALRSEHSVSAGGSVSAAFRLAWTSRKKPVTRPLQRLNKVFEDRIREADAFYAELQAEIADEDARNVQRQAIAGMLWSKQFYYYDVPQWLDGDPGKPPPPSERQQGRNHEWRHLNNAEIISMPDKWEYPWYAAWDLAFHCVPLAMVDPDFAKEQLVLMAREWYMHPNGQMPAYEWAFGDVNPPVHAWATWRVYKMDQRMNQGRGDLAFLERVFQKLLLNFTWWVNRKDAHGHNLFQGGFLGLDNIGVFDRSAPLPTGGHIEQADGTSWMAMYSLNLLRMSLELAEKNPVYQDLATEFLEHFLYIAGAMTNVDDRAIDMWDDTDEFYYDTLHVPDTEHASGSVIPLKIRSMVGLIPLFAVETLEPGTLERLPEFAERLDWFLRNRPDLAGLVSRWYEPGLGERRLLSLLRGHRMKCLLRRMLDETEFLSDYGVRALSRHHQDHPYVFEVDGQEHTVTYQPGESDSGLFGGNSNWRGPVWFPVNYLIIESLQKFHHYYGDDFKIECPTSSGNLITILEVAEELSRRLTRIFLRDEEGRRPVYNHHPKMQTDPHFQDHILFYEYFHGDNGRGVGASHQTGWTGLVAKLIQPRRPERI